MQASCGRTSLVVVRGWLWAGSRGRGGHSSEGRCKAALHAGEQGCDERIRGLVVLVLLRERVERRQAGHIVGDSGAAPRPARHDAVGALHRRAQQRRLHRRERADVQDNAVPDVRFAPGCLLWMAPTLITVFVSYSYLSCYTVPDASFRN